MRLPLISAVVCVAALAVGAVLGAGTYQPPPVVGPTPGPVMPERPNQGMIALACQADKYQQIVVLDTAAGVLAVGGGVQILVQLADMGDDRQPDHLRVQLLGH